MVKISEIAGQNPWWVHGEEFIHYDPSFKKATPIFFKRKAIDLKKGNIYILRGCRQAGKTTYLKDTIKELIQRSVPPRHILYLSLDFFTSRRELRNALNYFLEMTWEAEEIYLFLDEITSLEDWNLELKYLADRGIAERAITVCTGSSAPRLKEKGELLPGRGLEGNEYHFKPLTFRDFLLQVMDYIRRTKPTGELSRKLERLEEILPESHLRIEEDLRKIRGVIFEIAPYYDVIQNLFGIYLLTGGIPMVVNRYLESGKIDPSLSEVFIRSVLGDLSKLQRQETVARELLKGILDRYGSRYSFSKLSRGMERTHVTTIDYLQLMEESFILLIHYAYDFGRREAKFKGDKKIYFLDPFILHSVRSYLSGRDVWDVISGTLQDESALGSLVEGVVISHLLTHGEIPYLRRGLTFLWSYYDKSRREIDAVIKVNGGRYRGIEVKYQAQVNKRDVRKVPQIRDYIILSRGDMGGDEGLLIVPASLLLALLPKSEGNL
ncbi:ATP-binding protein [Candidatus Poribacteria bacterium]|nr:ATP-binding protein [Candidatus Poribacteria bacterium]